MVIKIGLINQFFNFLKSYIKEKVAKNLTVGKLLRSFITSIEKEPVILKRLLIAILLLLLVDILFRVNQLIEQNIGWSQIEVIITQIWDYIISAHFGAIMGLIGVTSAFIGFIQSKKAGKLLNDIQRATITLEDATRRNLHGFAEIFARALWLLEKSEQEIWYVNFLFGFGRPHLKNNQIKNEYIPLAKALDLNEIDYEKAVEYFFDIFLSKILLIPEVHAVVLNNDSLKSNFYEILKGKKGYKDLDINDEESLYKKMYYQMRLRKKSEGFKITQQDRIPFQMLITKINKESKQSEPKWACLIFLIGTENIDIENTDTDNSEINRQEQKLKEPQGFYTEVQDLVNIFKDVAMTLERKGKKFDWKDWEKTMTKNNTNILNFVNKDLDS